MSTTTSQIELRELPADRVAAVYDELLRPAFAEAELLSVDDLRELYLEPDEPEPSVVLLRDDQPVAVMLGEWFVEGRVLLLAYVAVSPHVRCLKGSGIHVAADEVWAAELAGQGLVGQFDDAVAVVARAESLIGLGGLAGALVELRLTNFSQDDVQRYLAERLPGAPVSAQLTARVTALTGGHPQAVVLAADLIEKHGHERPDVLSLFDEVRGS